MGQSTDAILFYGYTWPDEHGPLFDDEGERDWEEVLAVRRGISNPWAFYKDSGTEAAHNDLPYKDQRHAYEAWKAEVGFDALLAEWDAAKEAVKSEFNVRVSSHCSCDFPIPYIYIKGTEIRASRGFAEEVDVIRLTEAPFDEWNDELDRFIAELDIDMSTPEYGDPPVGPGWFLVSNWC